MIPVSQERRLLRNWLMESDIQQQTTSNNLRTETDERRSIILFSRPITRENNNRIYIRTPTTEITTTTTTTLQINSIEKAFPKRKYSAEDGDDRNIEHKQTPSFKRPQLIPLPLLRTIDYQYGRVMNRKRGRHSTNHEKELDNPSKR